MAGFIPDSLPPVTILSGSPTSPYRSCSHRIATSPIPTSSPISMLPRLRTKISGSNSSKSHPPETSTASDGARSSLVEPDSATPTRHIEYPVPDGDDTKTIPSPTTTKSPSPAPARTLSSKQKANSNFFGSSTSARVAPSRPKKRKKLDDKALAAEAAQLGLQLQEAVTAIEQGYTNVELARAPNNITPVSTKPGVRRRVPARVSIRDSGDTPSSTEDRETKRWSNAPLLPELDFGSSPSKPDRLFDPETHRPHPKATISVSILVDTKSKSNNAACTSDSPSKLTYRCDIHAQDGASHSSIEKACQDLVTGVGGRLLNSYFYPGGFLYRIPPGTPEPITTCELPSLEAKIDVEGWTAFSEPRFDGLRLHPLGGRLGGDRPVATIDEMADGLKARENHGLKPVDSWVESQGGVLRQRPSEGHNTTGTDNGKGEAGDITYQAVEVDDSPAPTHRVKLVKSLELLKRRVSGATRTVENNSNSSKTAQSPGTTSSNRYTVIMDTSESDSGSGAEEWESVRSELESQR